MKGPNPEKRKECLRASESVVFVVAMEDPTLITGEMPRCGNSASSISLVRIKFLHHRNVHVSPKIIRNAFLSDQVPP